MLWLVHIGGESGKHMLEPAYFNHYNILDVLSGPGIVGCLEFPLHFMTANFKM